MSKFILDTRLGEDHYVICTEAIRRGIIKPDDLNEGRRTMAEQWHFYRNQPPLAAFPNPNAPHIMAGRNNHAIDANSFNGAAKRLANFYESLGVDVSFEVPGEAWHFRPLNGAQLKRAADKIRRQRADAAVLEQGEHRKDVSFLKYELHFIRDKNGQSYYQPNRARPKDGYDDFFNQELETSVRKFQRDHGLKVDGKVGPKTDKKIDHVYGTQKRKRKSAKLRAQERKANGGA